MAWDVVFVYTICIWDILGMSVKGDSIQLNKGFRQYWSIPKLGGSGLLARFNFTSDSPKLMHITAGFTAGEITGGFCAQVTAFHQNKWEREKKKILLNAFALPRTEWVKATVVVGDEEQNKYLRVLWGCIN